METKKTEFSFFIPLLFFCFYQIFFFIIFVPQVNSIEVSANKIITVFGTGIVVEDNESEARTSAINNALVSAIDISVIDIVSAEALILNFETVNRISLNDTKNFIKDYKVLTEIRNYDMYRVAIQTTVFIEKLKSRLEQAGIFDAKAATILPDILILISEKNNYEVPAKIKFWWNKSGDVSNTFADSIISKILATNGFKIIEHQNLIQETEMLDLKTNSPVLNNVSAVNMGAFYNADVVIAGNAIIIQKDIKDTSKKTIETIINIRALRVATGEKIAEVSHKFVVENIDFPNRDITPQNITDKIRDTVFNSYKKAGLGISSKISYLWNYKQKSQKKYIRVIVEGTGNFTNFIKFQKKLELTRNIREVKINEINSDETILLVDFNGNLNEFIYAVSLIAFDSFQVNCLKTPEGSIKVQMMNR